METSLNDLLHCWMMFGNPLEEVLGVVSGSVDCRCCYTKDGQWLED